MFAKDAELLTLEPNLFCDIAWTGQRLLSGLGTISASVLTISSYDASFAAAGIGPGHVVLVGGVAYEVVSITNATHAVVSRLRTSADGAAIPPTDVGTPVATMIYTFAPQIAVVHRQVLRMAGIEPGSVTVSGTPGEDAITNGRALAHLEALGTLHLIFSSAGSLTPVTSPLNQRAEMYRQRFAVERQRAGVEVDLDGDGRAEARRMLNVVQFVRA